jgi:hypothetical protein
MTFNENLINIIINLLNNKRKGIKLIKYIEKMESKSLVNNIIALFILKSIIIIISYYPNKRIFIYNFIKSIYKSKLKAKYELFKNINTIDLLKYENTILDDYYMDKLIFKTFNFIYNSYQINKKLPIILLNEIILNVSKIKTDDTLLKIQLYLLYLNKSNHFTIKNFKNNDEQLYLKIMEFCGTTTRLVNNYISIK